MKLNVNSKIRKITKALELRGEVYLYSRTQVYSNKLNKICTLFNLDYLMPWDEYEKKYPAKAARKKKKGVPVRVEVVRTFREIEVLLYLVNVLKAGDDGDGRNDMYR